MPQYRRSKTKGGAFFFTVCTLGRQPLLIQAGVRTALRAAIKLVRSKYPFSIDAWVLMPDHLHCIWTLPEDGANFGLRWALIKQQVTKRCAHIFHPEGGQSTSRIKRRESGLWQRRFWEHQIRDETDLLNHMNYLHWNPVKHGHVRRVSDWPYSTFHRFVAAGIYPRDWGGNGADTLENGNYGE